MKNKKIIHFTDEELEDYKKFELKGNILIVNGKEYLIKSAHPRGLNVIEK